jgi:hypothetical protein
MHIPCHTKGERKLHEEPRKKMQRNKEQQYEFSLFQPGARTLVAGNKRPKGM